MRKLCELHRPYERKAHFLHFTSYSRLRCFRFHKITKIGIVFLENWLSLALWLKNLSVNEKLRTNFVARKKLCSWKNMSVMAFQKKSQCFVKLIFFTVRNSEFEILSISDYFSLIHILLRVLRLIYSIQTKTPTISLFWWKSTELKIVHFRNGNSTIGIILSTCFGVQNVNNIFLI